MDTARKKRKMKEQRGLIIVDDEERVTQSLEREIKLEFGSNAFEITTFTDPTEALSFIKENSDRIFLVISDLRMPEMNGSELLEKIRSANGDVQTILLTAYTDLDSIQRAISASIQSLIFKPWTKECLIGEITKAQRVWELKKENRLMANRIDGMLRSAGDFQQKLFSQVIPETGSISFSVSSTPLDEYHCGGDFYDILDAKNGRYMVLLGDVTGHGPKPAMIAVMLKTILKPLTDDDPSLLAAPDRLLKSLNDKLCALLSCTPETLIAVSAVYLDPVAKTLSIATAGLPPVLHIRNGVPELLRTPNRILGAFPDVPFYKTERALLPGDRVVFFTDGLVESVKDFHCLTTEEYLPLLTRCPDYSAEAIRDKFRPLIGGGTFSDDATVISLCVERLGPS